MVELRPHQERAMDMLRTSLAQGNMRPMLQAPTGYGKTHLAAAIVQGALAKGKRVIFTVPAISLIDQTVQRFWSEGIREVGVIQSDHPATDPSKPVQVASIQTLMRKRTLPPADLVLVDEAHRWFKWYAEWFKRWNNVPFIGLSATPWTRGLGKHYDDLLIPVTTQELIDAGYLSPFRVFAPSHPDLRGVRTVAGDYHEGDLAEAMGKGGLTADVVSTWKRLADNRPTLCFAVNRAHAQALHDQFERSGVASGYCDAYTPLEERQALGRKLERGEIRVVCNVGVLTTGVDWDVRCISLCRPTKSEMLYTQIIGRGLRTADGKEDCLILDHSDTTLNLGFVTDIHHDRLCDGTKTEKQKKAEKQEPPKPKECVKCGTLKAAGVRTCPNCGFTPTRQADVEHEEGELEEVKGVATMAEKEKFYRQLLTIQRERGRKDGWVAQSYRAKYKVWPVPARFQSTDPMEPTPDTRSYVRHLDIRYAKSRGRRAA